jgi:ABC-2 type transport system permease protein
MKTLLYILQKEFIQIVRNKMMLRIIIMLPIVQLVILVYAATFEVTRIDMAVVDNDRSAASAKLINKIENNAIFHINYQVNSPDEAEDLIRRNKIDIALCIPKDFEKKLITMTSPDVQLLADAIVGNSAQLGSAYLSAIIGEFNKDVLVERMGALPKENKINVINSFWYNPDLNYKIYMTPGILVVLITIIGMLLGSINLVREKELGTIEQINVTPISKWQLLAGKLIPFLIIGLLDLAFGLLLGHLLFSMPIVGSLFLLFSAAAIYLILVLSIGLLMSTISETQQQVAFSGFFFIMIFVMLSGLFTPIESMPVWAQRLDYLNPLYYFIKIMRGVILKGAQLKDILTEFVAMAVFAGIVFTMALLRYKKTS